MSEYTVVKTEDGYTVDLGDGNLITVSKDELNDSIDSPAPKFQWKNALQSVKSKFQFPKPVRALLFLKTEEERMNYLRSMPTRSVESLTTAITYVILKGNVVEKAVEMGITIPEKVQLFINEIDAKVKKSGELTVTGVKAAVQTTKNIIGAAAVVLFGIALLTNPAIMVVLLPLFLATDVIGLFKDFSDNKEK
ncbi:MULTISPECIES: hypothetical protein [Paenibacillus]|uniref:hypothetical protein n=1 Tax=Paenibacillus TaxID=44249 RepID=UPI000466001D|nr:MULTISPECIES: hypothetical protein [Paenibacillus]KGP77417.1 hypothetical protein P364_0133165 [Paenibacillus sp. MAEPY2]KGP79376.1 hypothetical protein P363_0131155 [Paenibacillus sp. MAEPY1]OZQ60177.1 hypothetical protein CA599_30800 [Paenibacillus taichungensis]